MPSLDIFNNDAFSVTSLTRAINDTPFQPSRIAQLGWFSEEGISTTSMMMERQGTQISLVPAGVRGQPAKPKGPDKSKMVTIGCVHLPQRGHINADEVQNVRAFGSESEVETVQNLVNKRLVKLRRDLDTTIEYQRIGAMKGQVLDADGTTVLLDLFSTFGLTKQTVDMNLDNDATKLRSVVVGAKRKSENALGALQYRSMRALCASDFFDAFVDHPAVQRAYDNFQDRAQLQEDLRKGFMWGGIYWEEYRGQIGSIPFIASGRAHLVPEGVPDLFSTFYAPADYMETVNTNGLPYYAKQQLADFGKGVEIESQSNPISVCTRPDAIIELQLT
jgi:hypothetical protein